MRASFRGICCAPHVRDSWMHHFCIVGRKTAGVNVEIGKKVRNVSSVPYAFTRPIVDHVFKNYDGVLKVDGDVGKKKTYDPCTYLALSESSMAERVKQAVI